MPDRRWRPTGPFLATTVTCAGLVVFFVVRPALSPGAYYRARPGGTAYDYRYLIAAAFIPYALAIRSHLRGRVASATAVVAGAVVLFAALVPAPAQQSQDVYQYLVYGRVAAGGANPYVDVPAFRDEWTEHARWLDAGTVYGPIWTMLSTGVVRASGRNLVAAFLLMKALTAAFAIAAALLLFSAGRSDDGGGGGTLAVLVFAYNPLVLFSTGLGAHADAFVAAAFAAAILFQRRGRELPVTIALALAALVKVYAALALVAWLVHLATRNRRRVGAHAGLAAGLAAVAYAPYWAGAKTFLGLAEAGRSASLSLAGGLIRLLAGRADASAGASTAGTVVRAAGALVMALALAWAVRAARAAPWETAIALAAVYVLVTPWFLYWHLVGLIALVAAHPRSRFAPSILTFSGTSLFIGPTPLATVAGRYGPPLFLATRSRRAESLTAPSRSPSDA